MSQDIVSEELTEEYQWRFVSPGIEPCEYSR